jgi:nucleoside-diphosphate kinase
MERSLVIIKPDGVSRGLIGDIISRYERKGFHIVAGKLIKPEREIVEYHYDVHRGKSFFEDLINYFMEGQIFVLVVEGEKVVDLVRRIHGDKDPSCALPGTIRGTYASSTTRNIVHASDSVGTAAREISIWFPNLDED